MNKDRETIIIVRRRKAHGHGHHGGAWKVAFADFMTAMFALFLVLWLVNQSSDVKSSIAGYFQDPLGHGDEYGNSIMPGAGAQAQISRTMREPDAVDLRRAQMQQLGERIAARLKDEHAFAELAKFVEIDVTPEGLRIQLVEDSTGVFFETGSAMPRPLAASLLATLGGELAALPNDVVIEGHTDARPYLIGSPYSNWELSADRANTSRRILTAGGLRPHQIVQVRGHADRQLRVPADPTAPGNRRVAITMLFGRPPVTVVTDTLAARAAP